MWDIAGGSSPFSARPGAAFPQEIFDLRIREELKRTIGKGKIPKEDRLAVLRMISALPDEELALANQATAKVAVAFLQALTMEEHIRLAEVEGARPESYYEARCLEAIEWIKKWKSLPAQQRMERWKAVLDRSDADMKGDIRERYQKVVSAPPA